MAFFAALGGAAGASAAVAGASLASATIQQIAAASGAMRTCGIEVSNMFERTSTTKAYLKGDWIMGSQGKKCLLVTFRDRVNGETVYGAEEDGKVKMVTESGVAKYFDGKISQFSPADWNTYKSAGTHYHLVKEVIEVEIRYKGHYLESGVCNVAPQPTVEPGKREALCFKKTDHTACGTVGVIVWTVRGLNTATKAISTIDVALMWSVPYDYGLYSNWFAVEIRHNMHHNQGQYYDLYNGSGDFSRKKANQGLIQQSKDGITVCATMADVGQSVIKIEFKPT